MHVDHIPSDLDRFVSIEIQNRHFAPGGQKPGSKRSPDFAGPTGKNGYTLSQTGI
ncbi:MAG: hypothetical protein SynsKO_14890 [Synoicihabitans sp.]